METYMIKDAAKELNVEAHVLRYWEEELGLAIKRNSMGHRYYDEKDILIFKNVQELKKRGLSLKDIREGIEKAKKEQTQNLSSEEKKEEKKEEKTEVKTDEKSKEASRFIPLADTYKKEKPEEVIEETKSSEIKVVDFKLAQLQSVMNKVIANALRENKEIITESIKEEITGDVMKQFDTVMREKEEREEKRFKKLDEYLRELQRANMEAAATRDRHFFRKRIRRNA